MVRSGSTETKGISVSSSSSQEFTSVLRGIDIKDLFISCLFTGCRFQLLLSQSRLILERCVALRGAVVILFILLMGSSRDLSSFGHVLGISTVHSIVVFLVIHTNIITLAVGRGVLTSEYIFAWWLIIHRRRA
jgi:hypothetical protein